MLNTSAKQMKKVITEILLAHGLYEQFGTQEHFHVRIHNPPFVDLVIERHAKRVMVAHYFEQNGDLIPDPDI